MTPRSQEPSIHAEGFEKGQRLYCPHCHFEIEVINPSITEHPQMVLRCCGEPMRVTTAVAVHLADES